MSNHYPQAGGYPQQPQYSQGPGNSQYPQQYGGYSPQQGGYPQQNPNYNPNMGRSMTAMAAFGQHFQQQHPGMVQGGQFMQPQPNPYAGQSLNYRQQNWSGYQMGTYTITPQFIEQYAAGIFQYFDRDRSGSLDMSEVPVMINHLFNYLKMPPPTFYDVLFLMFNFDRNGDGKMDLGEFKAMLYFLAGKR